MIDDILIGLLVNENNGLQIHLSLLMLHPVLEFAIKVEYYGSCLLRQRIAIK